MSYKSPVELYYNDIVAEFDAEVLKCVQKVVIDVDKDELYKALRYDREQYEKGYEDGRKDAVRNVRH